MIMKNFKSKFLSTAVALLMSGSASWALFTMTTDRIAPSASSTPVLSACGGATAGDTGSSDMAGTVTQGGTVTTCTITFGTTFVAAPSCIVQDMTGVRASMGTAVTATAIAVTGITAADKLSWLCFAKAGG